MAATTEEISREGIHRRASYPPAATATIERPVATGREPPPQYVGEAREIVVAPPSAAFPWGDTFALIGAIAVIISSILDWHGPFEGTLPRDIPAAWLLEPGSQAGGPSLGLAILFAGTLGSLVALLAMAAPGFTFLRRVVGLLTLMIPMAFAFRTLQLGEGGIIELPSALGVGLVVAACGSLVQLVAGKRRR